MILNGDCIVVLRDISSNSVDAVVTDPPYGLAFMGKRWDYDVPSVEIWKEVLRVLKPGGHLLSFGGTRTYHRMVVNIEDAGFEIRDQLQWIYGQGFPKSHDISKAIDKAAGAEREVIGIDPLREARLKNQVSGYDSNGWDMPSRNINITAPSTEDAKRWQGWGSALKPANEPICMARKPLDGTLAQNTLKWGCGGINVDAGRIPSTESTKRHLGSVSMWGTDAGSRIGGSDSGRFPSNVLLDEAAAEMLDEQSGQLSQCGGPKKTTHDAGMFGIGTPGRIYKEENRGASRFFYVAKASKSERNAGLEGMPQVKMQDHVGKRKLVAQAESPKNPNLPRANFHPTVKPLKLMEYLIKLVTPPGGIVLDPFAGSGTTLVAAKKLGFDCVGIEREREYCEISEKRLEAV